MTRWEYHFTHITNVNFPESETAQDLVSRLGRDVGNSSGSMCIIRRGSRDLYRMRL